MEVYDTKKDGLMIRVTHAGTRTFAVYRRVNGVPKRIKIGTYPDMTIEQARKRAGTRLNEISDGRDPIAEKRAKKAKGVTLQTVLDGYINTRDLKDGTVKDYRRAMRETFHDWMDIPITSITKDMIERRHVERGKASKARTNNAMRVIRALFNYAAEKYRNEEKEPIITENPVKRLSAIKVWHRVQRRKTIIKAHELPAWFEAVMRLDVEEAEMAHTARDYLLLLIFTGLRRTEAAKLEWNRVDLVERTFTVVDTKNREDHTLPLSTFVSDLLTRRASSRNNLSPFVFPGGKPGAYLSDPRWWVNRVSEVSGVTFILHDLRRVFTTVAESLDISVYSVKRLLNHKMDKADVTAGYIVTDVERLRRPMQQITDYLMNAGNLKLSAEVVELNGKGGTVRG